MMFNTIYSHRKIDSLPFWDIVFEWEDIFEKNSNFKIKHISKFNLFLYRVLNQLNVYVVWQMFESILVNKSTSLYFEMVATTSYSFSCKKGIIPIFIDFYLKKDELEEFYKKHKNNKLILVSSLEVVEFLKKHNCPIPIKHFPLSLSDRYKTNNVFKKKHQIILAGRENPVLKSYLDKYLIDNPNTEYVYRKLENGKFIYYSNKYGELGEFEDRDSFIKLLQSCKIAFYSTPGMDGGKERTNGFNQVTPRIFEILAAQCNPIMRYEQNADTDYFKMNTISKSIENYNEFIIQLESYLNNNTNISYENYMNDNWTTERLKLLSQIS